MSTEFFGEIKPVQLGARGSVNRLAYRFFDEDEVVAGERLEDHGRFAVAYRPAISRTNWRWPRREEFA
jgi:xylose isomerase